MANKIAVAVVVLVTVVVLRIIVVNVGGSLKVVMQVIRLGGVGTVVLGRLT